MSTGRLELDLPEGWFRIDIERPTAAASATRLVDGWIDRHPQLAEHRDAIVTMLTTTAERARLTNAIYAAAAFGEQAGIGPTWAALVARVLAWPGRTGVDDFLTGMSQAARADDAVTSAEVVQIGGRRMVLVRQTADDGAVTTSFLVPQRDEHGVFVNLEFSSPGAPAPEHAFAHIVATLRVR